MSDDEQEESPEQVHWSNFEMSLLITIFYFYFQKYEIVFNDEPGKIYSSALRDGK